jgi:hypothetical protein
VSKPESENRPGTLASNWSLPHELTTSSSRGSRASIEKAPTGTWPPYFPPSVRKKLPAAKIPFLYARLIGRYRNR